MSLKKIVFVCSLMASSLSWSYFDPQLFVSTTPNDIVNAQVPMQGSSEEDLEAMIHWLLMSLHFTFFPETYVGK